MLKLCGETEDKLAQELIHFELQVERDVIEPLFLLAEVRHREAEPGTVTILSTSSSPLFPSFFSVADLVIHQDAS